jgi:hypothetical protein
LLHDILLGKLAVMGQLVADILLKLLDLGKFGPLKMLWVLELIAVSLALVHVSVLGFGHATPLHQLLMRWTGNKVHFQRRPILGQGVVV